MAPRTLTLLLADFARHLPGEGAWPTMPALQRLLSKGQREGVPADYALTVFDLFQLRPEVGRDLPVASLRAQGEGLDAATGWWLCADPVHLLADRDQLYLSASTALGVRQGEMESLAAELNRLYVEDGWQFHVTRSGRCYLRLPQPLSLRTTPTLAAMGHRVGEVLPQGADALTWQRTMTEIQMVLHASPVNLQRSEEGFLTANSLWFWGGGELPTVSGAAGWGRVVADDPLLLGLARLCGCQAEDAAALTLSTLSSVEGGVLWQATVASLESLEQELFAPLFAMLKDGTLEEVVVVLPQLGQWRVGHAALRRWWRRCRPLSVLLPRRE